MDSRLFFVYILASPDRVLHVGVTSDLCRRLFQHRTGATPGFARRPGADRLVYFETTSDVIVAIGREKQVKEWKRIRKLRLIEARNPEWKDLSEGWR